MKKLFTYLLSLCAIVSCLQEERSPEEILVPTLAQVENTESSLMFTSKVPKGSEKLVEECGFYYGTDKSLSDATKIEASMDVNNFAVQLPERNYGTTYYICSYITNGHGSEIRSDVSSYNLKTLDEYVDFEPVELVSYSKASRKAEVTFKAEIWSGVSVSEVGVCFGVTTSPSTDGKHHTGTVSDGTVTATLSNFDVDTQYYLRAYVRDGEHTAYGEVIPLVIKLSPPTLSSVIVSSVEASTALFSSSVTDNGGDVVSEVGFYYSTEEAVDPETSYKINQPYSDAAFSLQAKELVANTKYYIKAFAVNSAGTGYSQVAEFTTSAAVPLVSTLRASDVTESGACLYGNVLSDNGSVITERGFVWVKGTDTPTTESTKLKVDGTTGDFTAALSGLDPNQKYSFRAYAINAKGTSCGEVMTFTTIAGRPELSATKVTEVTETSANFTSKVTSDGGSTPTEVGFYYSKEESVNIETAQKVSEAFSSDNFTLSVSDLEVGTTYYVKAFALNSVGETYNSIVNFKTVSTAPSVITSGASKLTATSAELSGEVADDNGETITERGFVWMTGTGTPSTSSGNRIQVIGTTGEFSTTLEDLEPNQTYSFRAYAVNSKGTSYGETLQFNIKVDLPTVTTNDVTAITDNSAMSGGVVADDGGADILAKGVVWSKSKNPTIDSMSKTDEGIGTGSFTSTLSELVPGTTYYVRAYATNAAGTGYGKEMEFKTTGEAPYIALEAANCFIVSSSETYSFKTVKGNSSESVGDVASAEVLWESFGTSETPSVGSLISSVSYADGKISFSTPQIYREGNAVIAAKDASGTILWSWHIWLTDEPEGQVYYNNAGTMMDRNLGATSATPGDVGALGLLYQWGRKDPFLGSSSISGSTEAKSSITWPSTVSSNSTEGTIKYATEHPITFITYNSNNDDWYYTGSSSTDNTRWQSDKTIYDPCPAGWRVPDGGDNGVWSTALGSSSDFEDYTLYDSTNEGMNFSVKFGSASTIWYPASGFRLSDDGTLLNVGYFGYYWSVTPNSNYAYSLFFNYNGLVDPSFSKGRAYGLPVRCLQESK